jgi:hypothetical protein
MNIYPQNEEILVTPVTRCSYGTPTTLQSQANNWIHSTMPPARREPGILWVSWHCYSYVENAVYHMEGSFESFRKPGVCWILVLKGIFLAGRKTIEARNTEKTAGEQQTYG